MSLHVVVGAGPVGSTTARLLAARGEQVRLITRTGRGPQPRVGDPVADDGGLGDIECVAADATDAETLARHADSAAALYSCAGPAYDRWATDWPPLGASLIRAAAVSGAVLVTTGNLYGYGQPDGVMTEETPVRPNSVKGRVRAELWTAALKAHEAGRIRTAEVRGSDYLGAHALSPFSVMVLPQGHCRQTGCDTRGSGRTAQLDVRRRRRPDAGRGRSRRACVGSGVARAHPGTNIDPRARRPRRRARRRTHRPRRQDADVGAPPRRAGQPSCEGDDRNAIPVAAPVRPRLHCGNRCLRPRTGHHRPRPPRDHLRPPHLSSHRRPIFGSELAGRRQSVLAPRLPVHADRCAHLARSERDRRVCLGSMRRKRVALPAAGAVHDRPAQLNPARVSTSRWPGWARTRAQVIADQLNELGLGGGCDRHESLSEDTAWGLVVVRDDARNAWSARRTGASARLPRRSPTSAGRRR